MTKPLVSVIIPVRNEERYIKDCLDRIFSQTYPRDKIEVLVVDGMSEDRTRKNVEEFISRQTKVGMPRVVLVDNLKKTPYAGVNVGIKVATGDIICRVDARALIPSDYISKCVKTLQETGADNVGGIQLQIGKTLIQRAVAIATNSWFGTGGALFRSGSKSGFTDTVYLGCFRKEIFDKVGLFDESGPVISEDAEMNYRIRKSGGRVYLNKDIVVKYWAKETLRDLWKQYFIYGGGKAHSFLKIKSFTAPRQLAPLVFLTSILLFTILSFFDRIFLLLLGAMIASYTLADILISFSLAAKNKKFSLLPILIIIFPCIHLAWALGFFVRLTEGTKPGSHWRGY